jgi:hypothetical protein
VKHVFDGTFYATVATVIPVLFLALTLQGDFVLNLLLASWRWRRKSRKDMLAPGGRHSWGPPLLSGVSTLIGVLAVLVLIDGTAGEISALLALERQRASTGDQSTVMQAVVTLTVATGIALVVRFVTEIVKDIKTASGTDPPRSKH